jgi:uncharacterized membrane protein YozB (DUF420 family)
MVEYLPHINVALNSLTTVLLLLGAILAKRGALKAHRNTMISALISSAVFLVCYLVYHYFAGSKKFPTDTDVAPVAARYFYYFVLLTHVVLAALVPFLAVAAAYLGLKDRRATHKRVVAYAWPIWMYVSVTGIIVYLMLYQIYAV